MAGIDQAVEIHQAANTLRDQGQVDQAIKKYLTAIKHYEGHEALDRVAECWQMIGVSYKIENNLVKGIEAYQKAIEIFTEVKDDEGLGNTYRDLGIIYAYDHQYKESIPWLEKSIRHLKKVKNPTGLGISQVKLGLSYTHLNRFEQAQKYMEQGINNIRQAKGDEYNWFMEMTACLAMAGLDFKQEKYPAMLLKLWSAIGLIHQNDGGEEHHRRLAQIFGLLSHGYLKLKNEYLAVEYLVKSLVLVVPMKDVVREIIYEDFDACGLITDLKQGHPDEFQILVQRIDLKELGLADC